MSTVKHVILAQMQLGQTLIEMFTKDLSDSDYFEIPAPGANHVGWVLAHLACTEDWAVAAITGLPERIPRPTHELVKGGSTCIADASVYPARTDLDELFKNARAHTIESLEAFDLSKWDDASPDDMPEQYIPTVGSVWGMQATHQFWHIGQITVCRAALGKPRVLGGNSA
ncbi:MAG: DinB family protein [Phycisphaerae bacterium]|jgi:hypothetical protein